MTRQVAPRGWSYREKIASMGPNLGTYQAACGHYVKVGTYACQDCNLAPLSDVTALHAALSDLVDACRRDTPTGRRLSVKRAEMVLEQLD